MHGYDEHAALRPRVQGREQRPVPQPTVMNRTVAAACRPARLGPGPRVLQLQQLAGNRVVSALLELQREWYGDEAHAALSVELQTLISGATWKEIRKRVYPKESAPGIQRAKDRKAGKIPDLTGLGRIKTLEHFAAAIHAIKANWAHWSPDDRVKQLWTAANIELASAHVPGFLVADKKKMEFKGFFNPTGWQFVISEDLVNGGSLSEDDAAELANTTLHECRHAEQQFLAARFSAQRKDAKAIVAEQGIPQVIADKAVKEKFDAKTDKATVDRGKRMFQATVTDRAKNQAISDDDGLAELAVKRTEAETALTNLKAQATTQTIAQATTNRDALRAQITVVEQKYTLYRNILYEADAHEVGDAAEQAYKGWR